MVAMKSARHRYCRGGKCVRIGDGITDSSSVEAPPWSRQLAGLQAVSVHHAGTSGRKASMIDSISVRYSSDRSRRTVQRARRKPVPCPVRSPERESTAMGAGHGKIEIHRRVGNRPRTDLKRAAFERGMFPVDMQLCRPMPGRTLAPFTGLCTARRTGDPCDRMIGPTLAATVTTVTTVFHGSSPGRAGRAATSRRATRASRGVSNPMTPQSS